MYDLIGDIHGHCEELEVLLKGLGYHEDQSKIWSHPDGRKAIFLGDYIDRGPKILETVRLVRQMVESGNAMAIMGNHEFNALAFHTLDPIGQPCRPHTAKNHLQHEATLQQMNGHEEEFQSHLEWFLTLPLWIELPGFRAVHACWDQQNIERLAAILGGNQLRNRQDIMEASNPSSELYQLIEETLKGKEMKLPDGITFHDKDGHERNEIRIKWWEDPSKTNLRDYSVVDLPDLPTEPVQANFSCYPPTDKPVFFGHYWLTGEPKIQKLNVCCLDYSIAKGGMLAAYSWRESPELSQVHFMLIGSAMDRVELLNFTSETSTADFLNPEDYDEVGFKVGIIKKYKRKYPRK